jgi:hypothetical protein
MTVTACHVTMKAGLADDASEGLHYRDPRPGGETIALPSYF